MRLVATVLVHTLRDALDVLGQRPLSSSLIYLILHISDVQVVQLKLRSDLLKVKLKV